MTNKPPRPITAEDLERLAEPLKSSLWPLKHAGRPLSGRITYTAPARQFLRQSAEARRMVDDLSRRLRDEGATFIEFDYAEIEARVMAHVLDSRSVYDELGTATNDAIERLVNPAPYYNLSMCRLKLTLVQLAIAAVEGGYRPVDCFNHAVDGGIVFG